MMSSVVGRGDLMEPIIPKRDPEALGLNKRYAVAPNVQSGCMSLRGVPTACWRGGGSRPGRGQRCAQPGSNEVIHAAQPPDAGGNAETRGPAAPVP